MNEHETEKLRREVERLRAIESAVRAVPDVTECSMRVSGPPCGNCPQCRLRAALETQS